MIYQKMIVKMTPIQLNLYPEENLVWLKIFLTFCRWLKNGAT